MVYFVTGCFAFSHLYQLVGNKLVDKFLLDPHVGVFAVLRGHSTEFYPFT